MTVAALFLAALVVALVLLIMTKRVQIPIAMELGMGMIALGSIAAIDSIFSDAGCTTTAMLARWLMIGGGLVLILLNVIVRLFSRGQHRRVSDFIELDSTQAKHVGGGKG